MSYHLLWMNEECFLLNNDFPELSSSNQAFVWKNKKNAILTVGLHSKEYTDSQLTSFLKTIITKGLKLSAQHADFCVFEENWEDSFSLNIPRSFFLVFEPSQKQSSFYKAQDKYICLCPSLSALFENEPLKRDAWEQMKKLLRHLSP